MPHGCRMICAAHHRNRIHRSASHPLQRERQRMIGMHVWETLRPSPIQLAASAAAAPLRCSISRSGDHAIQMPRIAHRPGVAPHFLQAPVGVARSSIRRQQFRRALHHLPHANARQFFARFPGRQKHAFLQGQRFINRLRLQLAGNDEADQIRNHQRHDDRIIARHFEDHDHGGQRRANDAGERRAHADQRVRARIRGHVRKQSVRHAARPTRRSSRR